MKKIKYIRTKDNAIIVFSEVRQHVEFIDFEPISAGFITFFVNENNDVDCKCYGNSISLDLKSDEKDTALAQIQLLNYGF